MANLPNSIPETSPTIDGHSPDLVGNQNLPHLAITEASRPLQPHSVASATFAEALILGGSGQGSGPNSSVLSHLPSASSSEQVPLAAHSVSPSASMHSLCLLGKPWGEAIPLTIIKSKTHKDWGFVKGQIDYLALGNGWILFRFSNLQDIHLVWEGRPWFVSGLNLVLRRWEPFFDPFSSTIQRIDQWVKITRLPLELWEEETFKKLLADVGQFIKMDDITLNRSKGKFARVCLNIDITKPLRGSLFLPVPNQLKPFEVPISYEGLHEVCALCGSDAHGIETCPDTPKGPLEVIVEKFGATKIHQEPELSHKAHDPTSPLTEKWITVSPKKRGRPLPRRKTAPNSSINPVSPTVRVVSTTTPPVQPDSTVGFDGVTLPPDINDGDVPPLGIPSTNIGVSGPNVAGTSSVAPLIGDNSIQQSSPALVPAARDTSGHRPGPQHLDSPLASPLEGSNLEDDDVTMFLNLENEEDIQLSSESSKKRKLEEGEVSSSSHSTT